MKDFLKDLGKKQFVRDNIKHLSYKRKDIQLHKIK